MLRRGGGDETSRVARVNSGRTLRRDEPRRAEMRSTEERERRGGKLEVGFFPEGTLR